MRRFDANSYLVLIDTMDTHDVGRGRGGVEPALGQVEASALVIAVDSDRLFPATMSERIARGIPQSRLEIISSPHGHDGFLIDSHEIAGHLRGFLDVLCTAGSTV